MDWKEYEQEITEHFAGEYPTAKLIPNAKVLGRFSKVERQIDLLIEEQASDFAFRVVVDAKHRGRKLDVTDVEAFLGLVSDADAHTGVMVALEGYTPAAISRAHHDDEDIILDVLNFDELKHYQGWGGLPYTNEFGAMLSAPFGWVLDAAPREGGLAWLYQRGLTLEDAMKNGEWAYINFSRKTEGVESLHALCAYQAGYITDHFPDAKIEYIEGPRGQKVGAPTRIRKMVTESYRTPEYTGFVAFEKFVLMCVMFTPPELEKKNLRKLRAVLRRACPLTITHSAAADADVPSE